MSQEWTALIEVAARERQAFFFCGDGLFRPQRVELGVLVTWKVL